MNTIKPKLLASAPTLEKIKELIANYWYTKPEKITLVQKAETLWSVYQIGDIKYLESQGKIHENGLVKMSDNYVEFKKGRYRFMYSLVKSNPVKDSSNKSFETWENEKAKLEEMVNDASSALSRVTGDNKGGLTPDHIKESTVYKTAKNKFNIAFERLRKFNQNSPKEFVKLATLKRRESRKQNPIKVKKGPREYGVRSGAKLNLSQAMEIRDNDYRTRDAQHDYDPESVNDRIYELQAKKAERQSQRAPRIARPVLSPTIPVKVKWLDNEHGPTFAYLQLPDFPFYTVRIFPYMDYAFKVSILIDGVIQNEKLFKGLTPAINYAEREFLRMCSLDPDYIVSIKNNPFLKG